jgi:para-aminobenzoate synthetase component I
VKALGSIAEVEHELRAEGFFEGGAPGLVADVYLGYGLSHTLRRTSPPAPPEPCLLPPAAVRVRPADQPSPAGARYAVGAWERTWDEASYAAAVESVREAIAAGDVYQVNLVQHLSAPFSGDPRGLAAALAPLRPLEPRPLVGDGWAVVSASPELFLARRGRRVWTKPIKGTRPLGAEDEKNGVGARASSGTDLLSSEKDAAEHVMIVDLERNDLSRVCEHGSVRWPELMAERELAGVVHMVSSVEGTLRDDVGLTELLEAAFPGGSITGAPKISAIDHIAALEPVGRGASMGALGRVYPNGDLELALTIRTFAVVDDRIHLWVGGGIVWDSDPEAEIEESLVKAEPLLAAIGAPLSQPLYSRRLGGGWMRAGVPALPASERW